MSVDDYKGYDLPVRRLDCYVNDYRGYEIVVKTCDDPPYDFPTDVIIESCDVIVDAEAGDVKSFDNYGDALEFIDDLCDMETAMADGKFENFEVILDGDDWYIGGIADWCCFGWERSTAFRLGPFSDFPSLKSFILFPGFDVQLDGVRILKAVRLRSLCE